MAMYELHAVVCELDGLLQYQQPAARDVYGWQRACVLEYAVLSMIYKGVLVLVDVHISILLLRAALAQEGLDERSCADVPCSLWQVQKRYDTLL